MADSAAEAEQMDIDAVMFLEEQFYEDGLDAGRAVGMPEGHKEGRGLGFTKGFEIGAELGYYRGCVSIFQQQREPPERVARALASLLESLDGFSVHDPMDAALFDALDMIRGKFRRLVSLNGDESLQYSPPGSTRAAPAPNRKPATETLAW